MVPGSAQQPSSLLLVIHGASRVEPGHYRHVSFVWESQRPIPSRDLHRLGLGRWQCFAVWRPTADHSKTDRTTSSGAGHRERKRSHGAEELFPGLYESRRGANLRFRRRHASRPNQRTSRRSANVRTKPLHPAREFVRHVDFSGRAAGHVQRSGHDHSDRRSIALPAERGSK